MMGQHNSVASRMREMFPNIVIVNCKCHSLHLCASDAAKALPKACEDLVRNVYNHFSVSAKRSAEYAQYQIIYDDDIKNLIHPNMTRWLGLKLAVDRLLEKWVSLTEYFTQIDPTDLTKVVIMIVNDNTVCLTTFDTSIQGTNDCLEKDRTINGEI